jgi:PadR family transcriptional regulator, regulatory protein PadR
MAEKTFPSGLELLIMLSVMQLGGDAYGISIQAKIRADTGRDVSLGAIYKALAGLSRKGLVSACRGDPTPARGGRAKTFYEVTSDGKQVIADYEACWSRLAGSPLGMSA